MEIEQFKKLNVNRQIFIVDRDFQKYLKTVITNASSIYFGIPETTEDLYWLCMYEMPKFIQNFNGQTMKELMKFLGFKCKFFTLNRCKHLIGKQFSVLNNAVEFSDEFMENRSESLALNDSISGKEFSFDISVLTESELIVYKYFFIEEKLISDIQKLLEISRYKITKTIESIRKKLQNSSK